MGLSDTVHEGIKWQITDHGKNQFRFPEPRKEASKVFDNILIR